ncbi:helix-turn-helix domain-containing protein, partial [Streptomyces sp. ME02-6987-2C]|uniref:GlxA family transcriptional regulator n=2 Tax=unclassified Streptomyces TaxID=2593676 RepID=UPI0029B35D61
RNHPYANNPRNGNTARRAARTAWSNRSAGSYPASHEAYDTGHRPSVIRIGPSCRVRAYTSCRHPSGITVSGSTGRPAATPTRCAHDRGTTVAALCGGAFTLAQAGLLDGRRAITHWRLLDLLRTRHPRVTVVPDALFIEDDNIWTAAGTAAGIDLCLHLVRLAHGAEAAATIARSMVTAPFRTGTQAQFIEHPTHHADRDADALAGVREHALRHLDEPLTVADLAARAGMSPRSFARHFAAATGTTPLRWLLDQRIAAAQKLLERTDLPMPEVARRAGFGSEVMMRQHFAARLATSPRAYRAAFTGGSSPIAR